MKKIIALISFCVVATVVFIGIILGLDYYDNVKVLREQDVYYQIAAKKKISKISDCFKKYFAKEEKKPNVMKVYKSCCKGPIEDTSSSGLTISAFSSRKKGADSGIEELDNIMISFGATKTSCQTFRDASVSIVTTCPYYDEPRKFKYVFDVLFLCEPHLIAVDFQPPGDTIFPNSSHKNFEDFAKSSISIQVKRGIAAETGIFYVQIPFGVDKKEYLNDELEFYFRILNTGDG